MFRSPLTPNNGGTGNAVYRRCSPTATRYNKVVFLVFAVISIILLAVTQRVQAQDTILVDGSQWFGGQGVPVYKNTYAYPGPTSYYPYNDTNGIKVGVKWQCVELPQRLYTAKGWYSGGFGQAYAYLIYSWAKSQPNLFSVTDNNGSGYVPVPGDMIIHDHYLPGSEDAGHVCVVNYVDNNNVYVVEQNASATGQATYSRSGTNGSILARSGFAYILGVVHCLNNNSTNGGSDTDIWVDGFKSSGGNGSQGSPYNTVVDAVNAASSTQAVTIHITPGNYGKFSTSKHIHFVTNGSGIVKIGG